MLGVVGAFGGVLAGLGAGFLSVTLLGWPMHFPVDWMLVAVGVGVLASVVSGLYPAWRAARVDPIGTLRRESRSSRLRSCRGAGIPETKY